MMSRRSRSYATETTVRLDCAGAGARSAMIRIPLQNSFIPFIFENLDLDRKLTKVAPAHRRSPRPKQRAQGGTMGVIKRIGVAGAFVLALSAALPAQAQTAANWPSQPVRLVVGVGAGGLLDIYARLLAPVLQQKLGQPVIVENRLGSGGLIGARSVAEAKPDGYNLFVASAGTLPAALMHTPPPYTLANFTPVA